MHGRGEATAELRGRDREDGFRGCSLEAKPEHTKCCRFWLKLLEVAEVFFGGSGVHVYLVEMRGNVGGGGGISGGGNSEGNGNGIGCAVQKVAEPRYSLWCGGDEGPVGPYAYQGRLLPRLPVILVAGESFVEDQYGALLDASTG